MGQLSYVRGHDTCKGCAGTVVDFHAIVPIGAYGTRVHVIAALWPWVERAVEPRNAWGVIRFFCCIFRFSCFLTPKEAYEDYG